jgi:phenylpyruvate tautomerase PptA (4-oxalocrotonate tautomerase family)
MPISIQVTKGLLTAQGEREIHPRIGSELLKVHGLNGNRFMEQMVIGHLDIYPEEHSYVDGKAQSLAVIELKVPSSTFPTQEISDSFVQTVTDIVDSYKAGAHPKTRTFVNVTYAVPGAWGLAGKAYTNEALGAAIIASAA